MRRLVMASILVLAVLVLAAPATARVPGGQGAADLHRAVLGGVRADVTCHDPCGDPFQLTAWVSGSKVGGLQVKFSVKGRTYIAKASASGFAHYHLRVSPGTYAQGVFVKVTASVTHGGVTRSASTWFKPNYS